MNSELHDEMQVVAQNIADLYSILRYEFPSDMPGDLSSLRHPEMGLCGNACKVAGQILKRRGYQYGLAWRYIPKCEGSIRESPLLNRGIREHQFLVIDQKFIVDPTWLQFFPLGLESNEGSDVDLVMAVDFSELKPYLGRFFSNLRKNKNPLKWVSDHSIEELVGTFFPVWDIGDQNPSFPWHFEGPESDREFYSRDERTNKAMKDYLDGYFPISNFNYLRFFDRLALYQLSSISVR
jgi:hypothetical protein